MRPNKQFCTFLLDELLFGVELHSVQEVIRFQGTTRVPLAPDVVSGLLNLRGQIVTSVDLRKRLELSTRASDVLPMNVVVRSADGAVALQVDEIGDVVETDDQTFELPPDTLRGTVRGMILGVHKLDKKLLHVLDTQKACQIAASEVAFAERAGNE